MTTKQKIKLLLKQAQVKRIMAQRLKARGYSYFADMYRQEAQQHTRDARRLAHQKGR